MLLTVSLPWLSRALVFSCARRVELSVPSLFKCRRCLLPPPPPISPQIVSFTWRQLRKRGATILKRGPVPNAKGTSGLGRLVLRWCVPMSVLRAAVVNDSTGVGKGLLYIYIYIYIYIYYIYIYIYSFKTCNWRLGAPFTQSLRASQGKIGRPPKINEIRQ